MECRCNKLIFYMKEIRNTVGNIPKEWYEDYPHIGYDLGGSKIIRPGGKGDQVRGEVCVCGVIHCYGYILMCVFVFVCVCVCVCVKCYMGFFRIHSYAVGMV